MAVEIARRVQHFEEGNANQKDLLGGKGAGLAEMTRLGLPVPPGFTITTDACREYYSDGRQIPTSVWNQTLDAVKILEGKAGKKLGDARNPLLVSVRSGAKFSMPGMMDTVLNLGLNDQSVEGLAEATDNPRFAHDSYRRFIQMFGSTVMGVDKGRFDEALEEVKRAEGAEKDTELTTDALQRTVTAFKDIVREETGEDFPQDPQIQLHKAVGAVFDSWYGDRAEAYRSANNIPNDLGTAVNVVQMVFGNKGENSGTGVAFTRDPSTGEKKLSGEVLVNAQGEDVVAGIRTPQDIESLGETLPDVLEQFTRIAALLEEHYGDVQDMEFTFEEGVVYMLQTRNALRTPRAAVKIATDMVGEEKITKEQAVGRVNPKQVEELLSPVFVDEERQLAIAEGRLLTRGIDASPGAAVGEVVFDAETAIRRAAELAAEGDGKKVILVRSETAASDYSGMLASGGILTARGGRTSHAAVVARGAAIPAVVGASDLEIDLKNRSMKIKGVTIKEGDTISFDGSTGEVINGELTTIDLGGLDGTQGLSELLDWADDISRLEVWANADNPVDAKRAREYGAKGIGLCRTEHMFNETDRNPVFQRMIMAAQDAKKYQELLASGVNEISGDDLAGLQEKRSIYTDSLAELGAFQKDDFKGILQAMDSLPVIIRLLDPPLHEFLPNLTELSVEIAQDRERGVSDAELKPKDDVLAVVKKLHEENPMLGLRGVRLGLMYPEIYEMQVKAIVEAAAELKKDGGDPKPKIMIPLISYSGEIKIMRERLEEVIRTTLTEQGVELECQIGVMIETPRAAITADQIAEFADFFSFGTNDLTQLGVGFSRDDVEGNVIPEYVNQGIFEQSPFATFDSDGVGRLVRRAVADGRETKPELSIGICGEHGGEPTSIAFFDGAGFNYVSASPNRIPVARLAAAQAVLNNTETTR